MPRATPLITSFNGGELSPRIDARSDISKYYSGCRTMENFVPLVEGGALNMQGTYFVISTKYASKFSRLTQFSFSTIQTYALEFGDYYMRVYKDNGIVVNSYSAWVTATGYVLGDLVTSGGNYYRCLVAHTSGTFATDLAAGKWELTGGATDLAYEIPTPYAEADLRELKLRQSADTMYIFHPSYGPRKLTRTAHTTWTLSNFPCKRGTQMTITGITKANPAVVTCTDVPTTLEEVDIVYIDSVVGMTEVNDLYFTVGTVVTGAGGTLELSGVNSSAYTAYTSGGTADETIFGTKDNNPSCGTFFEQRLCMAGTNNNPQTFWLSATATFDDFTLDATDDSAGIEYTLVGEKVDRIYWLIAFEFLVAGTVGGVWKIGASSSADPISQANVTSKKQVNLGCKDLDPEIVSDVLLWVTRSGRNVSQFVYTLEKDKYVPLDMNRISKHITLGSTAALSGIVDMDYQKEPYPILWAVRADGQLLGMTYESQEQVFAWFRIVTDGSFESVAVISNDNEEDQIWVTVNRTIDGSTVRYVEYFTPFEFYSIIEDAFFVHSGLTNTEASEVSVSAISIAKPCVATVAAGHGFTAGDKVKFSGTGTWLDDHVVTAHSVGGNDLTLYDSTDTVEIDSTGFDAYSGTGGTAIGVKKVFTGLDHLEGETVAILADGAVHPSETVDSGSITLDYYANKVHIGLPYTSTLEPMKIHAGSRLGTSRGKQQHIYKLTASFYNTFGGKAGPDSDNLDSIPFGTGVSPTLFSGDKDIEFGGTWDNKATVTIVQDQPLPMTVIGLVPHLVLNE